VLVTFAKVLAPFMPFLTEEVYQRLVVAIDPAAPASVHWCDYPHERAELIDQALEERIAVTRTIVGLGRQLREENERRVRQPLWSLTVISREPAVHAAATASEVLIRNELNVKNVLLEVDEAKYCSISVMPNFRELGKRAGSKLKQIGADLAQWKHAEVARLEAGETLLVGDVPISRGDVLFRRLPIHGMLVATEGAVSVALDIDITQHPELLREGYAREFVSVLQQARKAAGLEVSDRIAVAWDRNVAAFDIPHDEVGKGIDEHAKLIANEVLAVSFTHEPGLASTGATEADLSGERIFYRLSKA